MDFQSESSSIIEDLIAGGWRPHFDDDNLYIHPDDPDLSLEHDPFSGDLSPSPKLLALLKWVG